MARTSDGGVHLDNASRGAGRSAGRGAYVHSREACWTAALDGGIAHALRTRLNDSDRGTLSAHTAQLAAAATSAPDAEAAENGSG